MMTREEQRTVRAIEWAITAAIERGESSYQASLHATADQLEIIAGNGTEVFKDYTPAQRRKMAKDGTALPDGSFPIGNCSDAERAIRAQGRAKPEKRNQVKQHIRRRVRALGCSGQIFDDYK